MAAAAPNPDRSALRALGGRFARLPSALVCGVVGVWGSAGRGLESMVMTSQSSPWKNGLRRSISARCFSASISRSRCCCCVIFSSSSSACCARPPSAPCVPLPPSPPSCRESASRCWGDSPCNICKPPDVLEVCPLVGLTPVSRVADRMTKTVRGKERDRRGIRGFQVCTK